MKYDGVAYGLAERRLRLNVRDSTHDICAIADTTAVTADPQATSSVRIPFLPGSDRLALGGLLPAKLFRRVPRIRHTRALAPLFGAGHSRCDTPLQYGATLNGWVRPVRVPVG